MLQRFDGKDGIELVININTGESFASLAGYSRMSGIEYSTIRKRAERLRDSIDLETAEIQTQTGLRSVTLLTEDLIADWIVSDNPKIARMMLKGGIRLFNHKLAGYQVSSSASNMQSEINLEDLSPSNQEAYKNVVTSLLNGDLTFDQRLRLLAELNKFFNIMLQFYKVGANSIVDQMTKLLQLFHPPAEDNMRLAVQVQKEYRESVQAEVEINKPIVNYVVQEPLKPAFKSLSECVEAYFFRKLGSYDFTDDYTNEVRIFDLISDIRLLYGKHLSYEEYKRKVILYLRKNRKIAFDKVSQDIRSFSFDILNWETGKAYGFIKRVK